jgi:hypothetical protein
MMRESGVRLPGRAQILVPMYIDTDEEGKSFMPRETPAPAYFAHSPAAL